MSDSGWRTARWIRPNPKCVFCDLSTEPTVVFQNEDYRIHGWRCPRCGFTLIHPDEIHRALEILRETAEIRHQ